ncbi:MAG: dienelactone hydrolase family protein [Chloroflexota bacterium]|nr:dienelactone hydrolase family protein [Chloroflexota bacterium]
MASKMKSVDKLFSVEVPDQGKVSSLRTTARDAAWTFVYAPGAGSNLRDPFGAFAAAALVSRGITTVRFQFPYMEAGRRGPDRPPVLEATWRAVIDAARPGAGRLIVGGRSMGGRIASLVVAQGVAVDALALFAYPLHPPGKPDQMRVEHFSAIRVPVLFCSGTRDAFASPEELRAAAKKIRTAKVHLLEGADHGFAVPKSSGRTRDDVWAEAIDAMTEWLGSLK